MTHDFNLKDHVKCIVNKKEYEGIIEMMDSDGFVSNGEIHREESIIVKLNNGNTVAAKPENVTLISKGEF